MGHILHNHSFRKLTSTLALLLLLACDSGSANIAQGPTNTGAGGSNSTPSTGGGSGTASSVGGSSQSLGGTAGTSIVGGAAVVDGEQDDPSLEVSVDIQPNTINTVFVSLSTAAPSVAATPWYFCSVVLE